MNKKNNKKRYIKQFKNKKLFKEFKNPENIFYYYLH